MNRRSVHISIPNPCHESWDRMDATTQGAFCHSCQKEVIDFTAMTDREVVEYLQKHQTGCGRFRKDQIDAKLSIPETYNGILRWRALLLGLLPLFPFRESFAASPQTHTGTTQTPQKKLQTYTPSQINVSGIVVNELGDAIGHVSIEVSDSADNYIGPAIHSDETGHFAAVLKSISTKKPFKLRAVAQDQGYISETLYLNNKSNQHFEFCMKEFKIEVVAEFKTNMTREIVGAMSYADNLLPIDLDFGRPATTRQLQYIETKQPTRKEERKTWIRRFLRLD